jgi:hypothetical protein
VRNSLLYERTHFEIVSFCRGLFSVGVYERADKLCSSINGILNSSHFALLYFRIGGRVVTSHQRACGMLSHNTMRTRGRDLATRLAAWQSVTRQSHSTRCSLHHTTTRITRHHSAFSSTQPHVSTRCTCTGPGPCAAHLNFRPRWLQQDTRATLSSNGTLSSHHHMSLSPQLPMPVFQLECGLIRASYTCTFRHTPESLSSSHWVVCMLARAPRWQHWGSCMRRVGSDLNPNHLLVFAVL